MPAVRSTADAMRPGLASTVAAASLAPGASPPPPAPMGAPMGAGAPDAFAASPPSTPAHATASLFTTDREYPSEGADVYGALPETAQVYGGDLPPSDLAKDPVYARGEEPSSAEAPR